MKSHGLDEGPHLGVAQDVPGVLQVAPVVAVDDDLGVQAAALEFLGELLDLQCRVLIQYFSCSFMSLRG